MNYELREIILLAMDAHLNDNSMESINILLLKLFGAKDVIVYKTSVLRGNGTENVYLPIVNARQMQLYYEIVSPTKEIGENDMDLLLQVLTKMHINMNTHDQHLEKMNVDVGTGLYNRNCYIGFVDMFDTRKINSIDCLYVDINGLHEMNNVNGHECGDMMILEVANTIKRVFSDNDYCFRIGGDEFLIFCIDTDRDIALARDSIKSILEIKGIHVSCGISNGGRCCVIKDLVKEADKQMYYDKERFYSEPGRERRKR